MAPRSRQKRPQRQERRTVLLVTNGRVTERTYLEGLRQRVDRTVSVKTRDINGDPLTVIKELSRPRANITGFAEVWIVVDHDGTDRSEFLAACQSLSAKQTAVHGVVSVPCFEVWLNAHYDPIHNYQDQADAQRHYRELTGAKRARTKPFRRSSPGTRWPLPLSSATSRQTGSLTSTPRAFVRPPPCPISSPVSG